MQHSTLAARLGLLVAVTVAFGTPVHGTAAQGLDADCSTACSDLTAGVARLRLRIQQIPGIIDNYQAQLRSSTGVEKSDLLRRVRALENELTAAERNLPRQEAQLARSGCPRHPPRATTPDLRSALMGTATITLTGRGTLSDGPYRAAFTVDRPATMRFTRNHCAVELSSTPLIDAGTQGATPGHLNMTLVASAGSAGIFHPIAGTMENIGVQFEVSVLATQIPVPLGRVRLVLSTGDATRPGGPVCRGSPLANGSLTLVGSTTLTSSDDAVVSKHLCLALAVTISPVP